MKYKKGGTSLCTLYPMNGYFIALVVIGEKQRMEADVITLACCNYVKDLYERTQVSLGGKWLMISVKDQVVLNDVYSLIGTRAKKK